MFDADQDAALKAALDRIGLSDWADPSTVLASAKLGPAKRMAAELAGPDGRSCILTDTNDGCRRFHVEPDVDDFAHEVHRALAAGGYRGAEIAVNDVAPGGRGLPGSADITQLRGIPVTFTLRKGETEAELIERGFGDRFDTLVKRENLNPLRIRDTIADRVCAVLEIEAPILLRDEAERARATAIIRRIAAYLGADVVADPLPGIVPLAGSEMMNVTGLVVGNVAAYRLPPRAPVRKLPSSLDALEHFAALLEAGAASLQN